jgi:hypothetical protein
MSRWSWDNKTNLGIFRVLNGIGERVEPTERKSAATQNEREKQSVARKIDLLLLWCFLLLFARW